MLQFPLPDLEDIWDLSPAQHKSSFDDVVEPRERRFPFYYWYATRVFRIKGAGNRFPLPKCVVWSIRAFAPNYPGEAYSGGDTPPPEWIAQSTSSV
jgi:hypothetical protein